MLPLGLSLIVLVLVGALLVMGGNFGPVPLNLLFLKWEKVPVLLLILLSILFGILIHYLFTLPGRMDQWLKGQRKKGVEKTLAERDQEINRLREELERCKKDQDPK